MSPTTVALKTYHVMCTVLGKPTLLQIDADYLEEALYVASSKGTDLIQLFITRSKP